MADESAHPLSDLSFLLTSAGIKNASIHDALVDLLGKPIADSNALCIPTAGYGHPRAVLMGQYAIDDETAIKVTDDNVEVVSEGHWKLFTP